MARTALRPPHNRTPQAVPLPADVRLMNTVANTVFVLAGVGAVVAGVLWLMRSPLLPIRGIQLEGDLARNSVSAIRANAAPQLAGNFISVDLQHARSAFETVPWVRHAVVRRLWPDRLAVHLEEHHAAAFWQGDDGADKLVNSYGEVFEANTGDIDEDELPTLSGPEGSAAVMLSLYQRLQPLLARLDMNVKRLHLSGRGSWRVALDDDTTLELGRGTEDELLQRTERFVRTLPQATRGWQAPLEYADLRHTGGYAVRLRGVSTTSAAALLAAGTPPAAARAAKTN